MVQIVHRVKYFCKSSTNKHILIILKRFISQSCVRVSGIMCDTGWHTSTLCFLCLEGIKRQRSQVFFHVTTVRPQLQFSLTSWIVQTGLNCVNLTLNIHNTLMYIFLFHVAKGKRLKLYCLTRFKQINLTELQRKIKCSSLPNNSRLNNRKKQCNISTLRTPQVYLGFWELFLTGWGGGHSSAECYNHHHHHSFNSQCTLHDSFFYCRERTPGTIFILPHSLHSDTELECTSFTFAETVHSSVTMQEQIDAWWGNETFLQVSEQAH